MWEVSSSTETQDALICVLPPSLIYVVGISSLTYGLTAQMKMSKFPSTLGPVFVLESSLVVTIVPFVACHDSTQLSLTDTVLVRTSIHACQK